MRTICVQVQPDLIRQFDNRSIDAMRELREDACVQRVWVDSGDHEGPYVDIQYETNDASKLWSKLQMLMANLKLQAGCIVTCTGRRGWTDYLLLYHFDASVPTSKLPRQRKAGADVA